jgi:hypothetical protein
MINTQQMNKLTGPAPFYPPPCCDMRPICEQRRACIGQCQEPPAQRCLWDDWKPSKDLAHPLTPCGSPYCECSQGYVGIVYMPPRLGMTASAQGFVQACERTKIAASEAAAAMHKFGGHFQEFRVTKA